MTYALRLPVNDQEFRIRDAALRTMDRMPSLAYVRFTLPPESLLTWDLSAVPSKDDGAAIYTIKRDPVGRTEDYSILEITKDKEVVMLLAAECGLIAEKAA